MDLYEFRASLVYRVSSRTAKATQTDPVLKQANKQKNIGVRADKMAQLAGTKALATVW